MNRSAKEKEYDNTTAKYVIGKASTKKPDSIASDTDKVDERENPKRMIGKITKRQP
jgi:hypothetical protein